MDNFFDICAIEIWLIEADGKVETRVREAEHVPGNGTQLTHLVDVETWIDLADGGEDIVKDVTAMYWVAIGTYTRLTWERTFWWESKKAEVVVISASRADVVDVLDICVIEWETGSCQYICCSPATARYILIGICFRESNSSGLLRDRIPSNAWIVDHDTIHVEIGGVRLVEHPIGDIRNVHSGCAYVSLDLVNTQGLTDRSFLPSHRPSGHVARKGRRSSSRTREIAWPHRSHL